MSNSYSFNPDAARLHFEQNFSSRGEIGASVSVWTEQQELLALSGGFQDREQTIPWTHDTPVLVWSATKGLSAACLLHALHSSHISLDKPVAYLWPEFAHAGKQSVTLRMILHHQAGLPALDRTIPVEDRDGVISALAFQAPAWAPGSAHGYHPRTFGFLVDEIVLRATTTPIGSYWHEVFAQPMNLEFWIGLPETLLPRVAPILAPRSTLPKDDPFLTAFMSPGSLTSRSFASPRGLHSASAMNESVPRMAAYPGFGGIGTASALAKFYAMLACDGCLNGTRYFPSEVLRSISLSQVQGPDRVLHIESCFRMGFMSDPTHPDGSKMRRTFGPSANAFGHPGAGGSVAFADPSTGTGCAYVMNQMEPGVLPNFKSTGLWDAWFGQPC
ncbi:MAG: serine hydrolase domain-containing protein [Verrucomicrobiota bacterium]